MDPSPKITNPGDDIDTATGRKKEDKKDTIKYMDQSKAYLYGACKASLWKKK